MFGQKQLSSYIESTHLAKHNINQRLKILSSTLKIIIHVLLNFLRLFIKIFNPCESINLKKKHNYTQLNTVSSIILVLIGF